MTLTFDLLTPKSNQHIYEPKYICCQNWVKFPSLVFEIWGSLGFRVIAVVTWTFDLLTRKPKEYVPRPKYISDLILVRLAPVITKISYSVGFSGHCHCDLDLLTPKSNQHIYKQKYTVAQSVRRRTCNSEVVSSRPVGCDCRVLALGKLLAVRRECL